MNQREFEARVLKLWTTTRIPLTLTNLQIDTGESRRKIEPWLDSMTAQDTLEMDSDEEGELIWTVRGVDRPTRGLETIEEVQRLERLNAEIDVSSTPPATLVRLGRTSAELKEERGGGKKSPLIAGALSLFLGPIGWLYSAPLGEAIPAIVIYLIVCNILPRFVLLYVMGPISLLSAVAGIIYALGYNQSGERTSLFRSSSRALPPRRR
jgi:hypothetical protein